MPVLPRRTALLAAILGAAVLLGAPAALAHDALDDRKQLIDSRIADLRRQIDQAKEEEGVLSADIDLASSEIETLEERIGALTETLARLESELAVHRERLARLEERYRDQTRRLEHLVREHARAQRQLEERLVELYQTGETDEVEILLRVESVGDLIEKLEYFEQIGVQDRRIAAELKRLKLEMRAARKKTAATKARVAEATAALAKKTAEQRAARQTLVSEESALEAARAEKRTLLTSVREERHGDEEDLEAMQAASAALAERIQAAQAAAAAETDSGRSDGGGSGGGDSTPSPSGFIWPVSGPVTSGFGMRWGRMHEGIDISAASGTPVRAAGSGRVIIAGWMGGYGNLVVIDHGRGLATAYAHLSSIWVGGGSVAQGQSVGAVGCTGHCFGSHLHFEVRVNGSAVDPLGYL